MPSSTPTVSPTQDPGVGTKDEIVQHLRSGDAATVYPNSNPAQLNRLGDALLDSDTAGVLGDLVYFKNKTNLHTRIDSCVSSKQPFQERATNCAALTAVAVKATAKLGNQMSIDFLRAVVGYSVHNALSAADLSGGDDQDREYFILILENTYGSLRDK